MSILLYGQNTEVDILSLNHGRFQMGFNEQFDVDVGLTNKQLWFFNKTQSLAIAVFNNVSGRFGFLNTDEVNVHAALQDVSPSATMINDDPSAYKEFHLLLNARDESGVTQEGIFVKGARITSAPSSMTPHDEQHTQTSYIGATRYLVQGGGLKYYRIVGTSPAYRTVDDIAASGSGPYTATLPVSATAVNIGNAGASQAYLHLYYNAKDYFFNVPTGFSVSGSTVTIPSGMLASTDVWDIIVPVAHS